MARLFTPALSRQQGSPLSPLPRTRETRVGGEGAKRAAAQPPHPCPSPPSTGERGTRVAALVAQGSARSLVLFVSLALVTGADNWERFRGPNAQGTVDDANVPLAFGAKENVVWKVALPGTGNGSPVVWGNRLFLQSASTDSKLRTLHCIDTASGKILWERSVPGVPVTIRADSSSASSTPTVDGAAVYVSFWDGNNVLLFA